MERPSDEYVRWLEEQSILYQAQQLSRTVTGKGAPWVRPYTKPETEKAIRAADVWFTSYPSATITSPHESILENFADPDLWKVFEEIGVKALHTGPMLRSGSIVPGALPAPHIASFGVNRLLLSWTDCV